MGNAETDALDMPMKVVGMLLAAGLVIFFILHASQFNTLAGAAGSLVKDVGSVGS